MKMNILDALRANYRRYLLRGFVYLSVLVPLILSLVFLAIHEGDAARPHVPELKRIADEMPVYPDFEQMAADNVVLKSTKASLHRRYRTKAQFSDVRKFYDEQTAKAGWGQPGVPPPSIIVGEQHYVVYRRGSYEFGVYQENGLPNSYDIVVIWHG